MSDNPILVNQRNGGDTEVWDAKAILSDDDANLDKVKKAIASLFGIDEKSHEITKLQVCWKRVDRLSTEVTNKNWRRTLRALRLDWHRSYLRFDLAKKKTPDPCGPPACPEARNVCAGNIEFQWRRACGPPPPPPCAPPPGPPKCCCVACQDKA
ncbi:MAG: hypothetical protein M1831_007369 [Alyxoria varia]|nr:MAG: hypothetical protein M1831_007369 [Alyxoria varia]